MIIEFLKPYLEPIIGKFDEGNILYISIAIIVGAFLLIYIFNKLFRMKDTNYNSQQYWEGRYDHYTKQFDWYVSLRDLCVKFQLNEILEKKLPNKKKAKILELGCGNSKLSYEVKIY